MDFEENHCQRVCEYFETVNNRIDITKTSSFNTSELFVNRLIKNLTPYNKEICGTIEPFCDNRQQGVMLSLQNIFTKDSIYIWACESKTNQELMVITSNEKNNQNLFMKDDLDRAQYYSNNNYDDAITFVKTEIDKFLGKELDIKI